VLKLYVGQTRRQPVVKRVGRLKPEVPIETASGLSGNCRMARSLEHWWTGNDVVIMEDDQEQQGCTASWPDADHQVRGLMLLMLCWYSTFIDRSDAVCRWI